jgi:hypothetical protein
MLDAISTLFSGDALSVLVKTSGAALTLLIVIPALMKLLLVTIDEGSAAIRTRNGKPIIRRGGRGVGDDRREVVVLRAGTHGAFPIFYWYRTVDVRARSTDLPARSLTGADGHQHLVHASFDWRPVVSGRDLRILELDVVSVRERAGNIVGAALRDIVHDLEGAVLPPNTLLSPRIVGECTDRVRQDCGIELLSVVVTGDALTDGYLLSRAISPAAPDPAGAKWNAAPAVFANHLTSVR